MRRQPALRHRLNHPTDMAFDGQGRMLIAAWHNSMVKRLNNIGRPDMLEVNTSVSYIVRELGLSPKLTYEGGERGWVGDSPKILLDIAKLRALGWGPKHSLEASVVDTVRYLVQNPWTMDRR